MKGTMHTAWLKLKWVALKSKNQGTKRHSLDTVHCKFVNFYEFFFSKYSTVSSGDFFQKNKLFPYQPYKSFHCTILPVVPILLKNRGLWTNYELLAWVQPPPPLTGGWGLSVGWLWDGCVSRRSGSYFKKCFTFTSLPFICMYPYIMWKPYWFIQCNGSFSSGWKNNPFNLSQVCLVQLRKKRKRVEGIGNMSSIMASNCQFLLSELIK